MARRRAGERFVKDAPYDVRDKDAEIRAATSYVPRKSSRNGAVIFNIATFIATCAAVLGIAFAATGGVGIEAIVAMLLAALLVLSSTHIALSWEKVVVLRFGKLNRVVGPGLYFTIPVIEHGTCLLYTSRTCVVALLTVTLSVACVPSALALAEGDAASSSSASAASASSAATYEKSEVVYATLAASGAPKAVYVVNRFDVEVPGTVVDHGDYTSVQNLTNETELRCV